MREGLKKGGVERMEVRFKGRERVMSEIEVNGELVEYMVVKGEGEGEEKGEEGNKDD